jgi:hypothetical protein
MVNVTRVRFERDHNSFGRRRGGDMGTGKEWLDTLRSLFDSQARILGEREARMGEFVKHVR